MSDLRWRDVSRSSAEQGLYARYSVERIDGKADLPTNYLVLRFGDVEAWPAIRAYESAMRAKGLTVFADDIVKELEHYGYQLDIPTGADFPSDHARAKGRATTERS